MSHWKYFRKEKVSYHRRKNFLRKELSKVEIFPGNVSFTWNNFRKAVLEIFVKWERDVNLVRGLNKSCRDKQENFFHK